MKRQKPRPPLPRKLNLLEYFPYHLYPVMRPNQRLGLETIEANDGLATLEAPTGSGKMAIGYTFLKALAAQRLGPLFYIVPTKTQVDQLVRYHPDLIPVYGRNEHDCLYYPDLSLKADEIPTVLCPGCDHFVNQETGAVNVPGVVPCPYYLQKYQAKQAPIVVCTMAFYLFTQLFSQEWEEPAGLVIDEAHQFPRVVRNCLSYEITDYHLWRSADLLAEIDGVAAHQLRDFGRKMISIIKRKPAGQGTLLKDEEIIQLIELLDVIDAGAVERALSRAIRQGLIDVKQDRETLKQLETIVRDLRRYLHTLEYSLPTKQRHALNYTYGFYEEEMGPNDKAQYRLVIKAHYVAPIIAKILSPRTVAYSATIGDPPIFQGETGIRADVFEFGSEFSHLKTRVFMPTDTKNLAFNTRGRQDVTRTLRLVAKAARRFAQRGHRSLVVIVSEKERQKFLTLAEEERLKVLSYGNGSPAKTVAARFLGGEGDCLVGTTAQYGEGIDLPRQSAPVIFMLRPGYPHPDDPGTQFEERRFSTGQVWAIRQWRVMMEALQVRGRNIRSSDDLGVTFFMSQQFRKFLRSSLPKWLERAYRNTRTFDQCVEETMELLSRGDRGLTAGIQQ
ncbi:MAG: hypothetical protein HYY50_01185 [Candidatus Kerfeldbacteria bacterium]|nr:hypothetical protein [Candidatus Kerfeldbacteria bacterium]